MNTYSDKTPNNKNHPTKKEHSQLEKNNQSSLGFIDNRPDAKHQRKLQEMMNNSPQIEKLGVFQQMAKRTYQLNPLDSQPGNQIGNSLQFEQETNENPRFQIVQRRIHKWIENEWKPGDEDKEGIKPFPENPEGSNLYFNDVTGQIGETEQEAANLEELVMNTGSVTENKINLGADWSRTVETLFNTFDRVKGAVHYLGYYTINENDESWKWNQGGDKVEKGEWTDAISGFLKKFMIANGQMDHIRAQPWFKMGTHEVQVDANFYINRKFNDAPVYWHKDTGGGNLFVNLIFSNDKPIVGTEWTIDPEPLEKGGRKESIMKQNMPDSQIQEIEKVRGNLELMELKKQLEAIQKIKGKITGVNDWYQIKTDLLPRFGYVSWVDELIWHSSPFMGERKSWDKETAQRVLTKYMLPDRDKESATTLEAMILIANIKESIPAEFIKNKPSNFTDHSAATLWDSGYNLEGKHKKAVEQDIDLVSWKDHKIGSSFGHENDGFDPRVKKILPPNLKEKIAKFKLEKEAEMERIGQYLSENEENSNLTREYLEDNRDLAVQVEEYLYEHQTEAEEALEYIEQNQELLEQIQASLDNEGKNEQFLKKYQENEKRLNEYQENKSFFDEYIELLENLESYENDLKNYQHYIGNKQSVFDEHEQSLIDDYNTILSASNMQGRTRALSNAEKREHLRANADMDSPRNFLRTWVRVIPKS